MKKNPQWRKELRQLLAEAMTVMVKDLASGTHSDQAAKNMLAARNKIIRFVERLL